MKRRFLSGLRGQTLLVLVLGLSLSHMIGIGIYSIDRRDVVRTTEATDVAERIVGIVTLLDRLPDQWREDIVRGYDSRMFSAVLGTQGTTENLNPTNELTEEIVDYLQEQLPDWSAERIIVSFTNSLPKFVLDDGEKRRSFIGTSATPSENVNKLFDFLLVSLKLDDDEWLNFVAAIPVSENLWPGAAGAYILSVAVIVGGIVMWLVARVTAPLSHFADAAERLGKNIRTEPLPETGPQEVAQAAHALNEMQDRLRRLLENRTQMLAAISHDLRTPLTLLRLRAELMAQGDDQAKILSTLDEMEAMITSVLEFTKGTFHDEPQRQVDVGALIESICDDMADTGAEVECDQNPQILLSCRRASLKRAVTNVIDNAVKYGIKARVQIKELKEEIKITIDDKGPGIPTDQLDKIFAPFFKVDEARSKGKTGVGLGLSIAQTIIHAHGGTMSPENLRDGGLRVSIVLPK